MTSKYILKYQDITTDVLLKIEQISRVLVEKKYLL